MTHGRLTISRLEVQACISRVLGRRGDLVWTEVAPCGGLRRARSSLLSAGPRVGRRESKILAEILDLRRYDATRLSSSKSESRSDAVTRRRRAAVRRRVAAGVDFLLAATSPRAIFVSKHQPDIPEMSSPRAPRPSHGDLGDRRFPAPLPPIPPPRLRSNSAECTGVRQSPPLFPAPGQLSNY